MFARFYRYMEKYRKYAFLSCLCVVLETMLEMVIPFVMADIIDVGVAFGDRGYILVKGAQMCGLALLALILGMFYARFAAIAGQGLGSEIRRAEYKKIQSFSFANTDHFTTSSLVTRLTSDVTMIQNAVSTGIRPVVRAPVMLVTALGLAFVINARLAMIFVVALPILGFCLFLIVTRVRPMYTGMQQALDLVNRMIQENLTAIRVVKAYVRGEYEIEKFEKVNNQLQTVSERAFSTACLNMPAMQYVMYATIISILLFGGSLYFAGGMKIGELTGFLSYVLQILNSLMMISNAFLLLTRSMASGKRILEVMDEPIHIRDTSREPLAVERGEIVFDHVWFKYRQEAREFVLSDISFHIQAGQTVGIIGGTGSAKTTLVQLIPRLYDATEGAVLVDGRPVGEYPLEPLRDGIAMVLQKNTLFSGTIRENLMWGDEHATEEEMRQACETACAHQFIMEFPEGYDTLLEQGGVNLSGGQRQRLCIARALLKKPKVLILDDSTSAVDTATEGQIRSGLSRRLPDTTVIIIAQRISSVVHADQILILEDGRVHGTGTHESLLASNEIYQEIFYSQQEGVGL